MENSLATSVLDALPELIYVKDCDGRYLVSNQTHLKFHNFTDRKEILGKTAFDLYPYDLATKFHEDDLRVMGKGKTIVNPDEQLITPEGKVFWIHNTKQPLRDRNGQIFGLIGIARNITETPETALALQQHEHLLDALMETLPDQIYFKDRKSRFIRVNSAMLDWIDLDNTNQIIGKTDFDFFSYEHAQQAFEDEQNLIQTGEPILHKEEKETWPNGSTNWVSSSKLPIRDDQDQIIGLYGMSRDITERKQAQIALGEYTEKLQEMNARLETDLIMAGELQRSFLPQSYPIFPSHAAPESSLLQFAHYYNPTEKVGGDFFSVVAIDDYRAGIFFSDVMGHGIRAALVTAMLHSLVTELGPHIEDPSTFLMQVNRRYANMLQLDWESMFATACFLHIDLTTRTLHIANAGHPNPFLLKRADQTVLELSDKGEAKGLALGISNLSEYTTSTFDLSPQDVLLLYTDGLYEVENDNGEYFDTGQLAEVILHHVDDPVETLFNGVLNEIRSFGKSNRFEDDVCLLAIEMRDTEAPAGRT